MTADKDPPDNVIPFPHVNPYAVGRDLRRYYQALVEEPLPEDIAALAEEFAKLAEGAAGAEKRTRDSKEKDTEEKV